MLKLLILLMLVLELSTGTRAYRRSYREKRSYRAPWWSRIRWNKLHTHVKYEKRKYHRNCQTQQENQGQCPNITNFQNGMVSVEGLSIGQSATFSCKENYTYCGERSIVCKNDLQWNTFNPLCIPYCYSGNLTVIYGNTTYFISGFQLNFNQSQEYCKSVGGNLLMINSREEQELIRCMLDIMDNNDIPSNKCNIDRYFVWHGVVKIDGNWQFVNREEIDETFWEFDQPAENDSCSYLRREYFYRWNSLWDDDCILNTNHFICEINV